MEWRGRGQVTEMSVNASAASSTPIPSSKMFGGTGLFGTPTGRPDHQTTETSPCARHDGPKAACGSRGLGVAPPSTTLAPVFVAGLSAAISGPPLKIDPSSTSGTAKSPRETPSSTPPFSWGRRCTPRDRQGIQKLSQLTQSRPRVATSAGFLFARPSAPDEVEAFFETAERTGAVCSVASAWRFLLDNVSAVVDLTWSWMFRATSSAASAKAWRRTSGRTIPTVAVQWRSRADVG